MARTVCRSDPMEDQRTRSTAPAADDTIQDLLNHPAFAGFARLLLPWDDRAYENGMRLRDVGSLLPYHSHVDPATVVGALNHMIDDVHDGRTVFYDFYTEKEKAEERGEGEHGPVLLPRQARRAVCRDIAGRRVLLRRLDPRRLSLRRRHSATRGYNAFVLKYRAGAGGAPATRDLAAAVSYVFRNAKTLGVSTEGYSLWGSSAGARMAAAIGSHGTARFGGDDLPKPSAVVMAYTGHSEVAARRAAHVRRRRRARWNRSAVCHGTASQRRCAGSAPRWNSIDTPVSVMVSVPVSGPVRKDGSTAPFGSGRRPSDRRPRSRTPTEVGEGCRDTSDEDDGAARCCRRGRRGRPNVRGTAGPRLRAPARRLRAAADHRRARRPEHAEGSWPGSTSCATSPAAGASSSTISTARSTSSTSRRRSSPSTSISTGSADGPASSRSSPSSATSPPASPTSCSIPTTRATASSTRCTWRTRRCRARRRRSPAWSPASICPATRRRRRFRRRRSTARSSARSC